MLIDVRAAAPLGDIFTLGLSRSNTAVRGEWGRFSNRPKDVRRG